MAISDRRYAAQLVKADGKAYFFDDIGCALQFLEAREWKDAPRVWVTDVKPRHLGGCQGLDEVSGDNFSENGHSDQKS